MMEWKGLLAVALGFLLSGSAFAAGVPESLAGEARGAARRGVGFLMETQAENGSWMDNVGISGLALTAIAEAKNAGMADGETVRTAIDKGRRFLLANFRDGGGVYEEGQRYVNYCSSMALIALATLGRDEDHAAMRRIRRFLIEEMQLSEDNQSHPTPQGNPFYGGIGYGSGGPEVPDLNNTSWALTALHLSRHLASEASGASAEEMRKSELAWRRGEKFVRRCQRIPLDAADTWRPSPDNGEFDGGFIYQHNASRGSGGDSDKDNLSSYGAATNYGLKSLFYVGVDATDLRVRSALEWSDRHYDPDFTEHPGVGAMGRLYYMMTFAQARSLYGADFVETPEGRRDWRADMLRVLVDSQNSDGSWRNEAGRWMESIPELATSYALFAINACLAGKTRETE